MLQKLARIASVTLLLTASAAVIAESTTTSPVPAQTTALPNFSTLKPANLAKEIDAAIAEYNAKLIDILKLPPSFNNTVQPLEENNTKVRNIWNLLRNANSVTQTAEVRETFAQVLPKMIAFRTDLMHNPEIYNAYVTIRSSPEFATLNQEQQVVIEQMLLEFKLSGAELNATDKQRLKDLSLQLSKLTTQYANNLLDAIDSWHYYIPAKDAQRLDGLPSFIKEAAANKAKEAGKDGWTITLDQPTVEGILLYAKDRELRKTIYTAEITVASDQDPNPLRHKWDNASIIQQILVLRQEFAQLLGYKNYAEYSLEDNEAPSTTEVMKFLSDLAVKVKPAARQELDRLSAFAMSADSIDTLEPWDIKYYADWLRHGMYGVSEQEIRKYLPTEQVLKGLFSLTSILYNMHISEVQKASVWNPQVKLYVIKDGSGNERGYFYLDLYTRPQKAIGGWTSEYKARLQRSDGSVQQPITFIVTNFQYSEPSLLTHDNVVTLFHEFGHMLQYNLTLSDYPSISGTNGISHDAVEVASQFMETWAWQLPVLTDISKNIDNSTDLPPDIIEKLIKSKNFNAGLFLLRQLELAIFDMRIYINAPEDQGKSALEILQEIRQQIAVVPFLKIDRFPNRFKHIFAGGYGAGYYGYLWSEVIAADAFAAFAEVGLFDASLGQKFLHTFLEKGGEDSTQDLFIEFRGRKPKSKYLLREYGIAAND